MPRKKHAEHVNLERWLVSYADFITLMFAFFVIMYAISRADTQKFKAASESLKKAFGTFDMGGAGRGREINPFGDETPSGPLSGGAGTGSAAGGAELSHMSDLLLSAVNADPLANALANQIQLVQEEKGLLVRLSARGFYDPGQAEVRADALPALNQIAKILATTTHKISVEGHTDVGRPAASSTYPSNWELSTARATWIVRYLIENYQIDPKRLEAAGYAEFHPIAPNDTEDNRAKNRRVEILILGK